MLSEKQKEMKKQILKNKLLSRHELDLLKRIERNHGFFFGTSKQLKKLLELGIVNNHWYNWRLNYWNDKDFKRWEDG